MLYLPKSIRESRWSATLVPTIADVITPRKLNVPLRIQALLFDQILELITPEIEFGASVNPFTNITPSTRIIVKKPTDVSVFVMKFKIFISKSPLQHKIIVRKVIL